MAVAAELERLFAEAEVAIKNPAVRVYVLQDDAEDRLRRPRTDEDRHNESMVLADELEKLENVRTLEGATQRAGERRTRSRAGTPSRRDRSSLVPSMVEVTACAKELPMGFSGQAPDGSHRGIVPQSVPFCGSLTGRRLWSGLA